MFGLGLPEILVILVVIVIFFYGGERIEEIARGLGRFTGEFKKGKLEMENEIKDVGNEIGLGGTKKTPEEAGKEAKKR